MKPLHLPKLAIISTLCALSLTILSLSAQDTDQKDEQLMIQDPDKTSPDQVQLYAEIIEISALQYAEIMGEQINSTNHSALRNKLLEQVKKGEAMLVLNQTLHSRSEERATSESIQEFIFPTQYEPAEAYPFSTSESDKPTPLILPPTPTSFETRNLGFTLEMEPTLSKGKPKSIDLSFRPENVKHTGFTHFGEWVTKESKVKIQMPMFYTARINTSLTVYDNKFTLVATHSPDADGVIDNSKKWLFFVKVNILDAHK